MRPDVSVIIPAYRAGATILRAVQSALGQTGVCTEVVVCADDDLDYSELLSPQVRDLDRLTFCRTTAPASGPSAARNVALSHARADIIATLDADDAYVADRLRHLLPLANAHGVATGPTVEVNPHDGSRRVARPRMGGAEVPIADICELRMPFAPVFHRRCNVAWAPIAFAEDVILNVDLTCATGAYPFVEGADYIYHLNPSSRSQAPGALALARAGYLEILDLVAARAWPDDVRRLVRRVFMEDLARVDAAAGVADGATWREIVRDGAVEPPK